MTDKKPEKQPEKSPWGPRLPSEPSIPRLPLEEQMPRPRFESPNQPREQNMSFKSGVYTWLGLSAAVSLAGTAQRLWEDRRVAQERAERRRVERERDHERYLRTLGKEPYRNITSEDVMMARRSIGYVDGAENIVVTGNHNSGKSSLVNAFRGLADSDIAGGAAPTGETETTILGTKYVDPRNNRRVWYDVGGAGTMNVSAWQYYYNQQLFAYDKVVLVHDASLTTTDIRTLEICRFRNQECILIRSKADQHIKNCRRRLGEGTSKDMARETYISQARNDYRSGNWQENTPAGLMRESREYIVSAQAVRRIVQGASPEPSPTKAPIDELALLQRLHIIP